MESYTFIKCIIAYTQSCSSVLNLNCLSAFFANASGEDIGSTGPTNSAKSVLTVQDYGDAKDMYLFLELQEAEY